MHAQEPVTHIQYLERIVERITGNHSAFSHGLVAATPQCVN
jgi:hypothetical protein